MASKYFIIDGSRIGKMFTNGLTDVQMSKHMLNLFPFP